MLTVAPDFARRIDLPGAGPCPRPVDIDRSHTGFERLVSLRVYSFAAGAVIDGEAENDEVFIVLMRGQAAIAVDSAGGSGGEYSLRAGEGARAVYLPPHAAYRMSARTDCDIAYARSVPTPSQLPDARGFAPAAGRLDVPDHALGMTVTLAHVVAGGELALAARDGAASERFVHVRSADAGSATVAGEPLDDWGSAILPSGQTATLKVDGGTLDVLLVSARIYRDQSPEGPIDEP